MAEQTQQVQEKLASIAPGGDGTVQFLTFSVEGNEYGVDIMSVREIKGWTESTRIPNSPEFMRGVMNLRGVVIPIFDLRTRFNMGVTKADAKNVVIVISIESRTIGILVDAVSDILTVDAGEVKASPAGTTDMEIDKAYISGLISVDNKMVVILNVENLFSEKSLMLADNASVSTKQTAI